MPKAEALAASWKMTTDEKNLISARTGSAASSSETPLLKLEDFSGGYMCRSEKIKVIFMRQGWQCMLDCSTGVLINNGDKGCKLLE